MENGKLKITGYGFVCYIVELRQPPPSADGTPFVREEGMAGELKIENGKLKITGYGFVCNIAENS